MDIERAASEVNERLELRGIDPLSAFTDLAAWRECCQVICEVVEDVTVQELIYGGMSNGGQFTGLSNLPGIDIDRSAPGQPEPGSGR